MLKFAFDFVIVLIIDASFDEDLPECFKTRDNYDRTAYVPDIYELLFCVLYCELLF